MGPLPPILAGGRAWPPPPGMLGGGLCSRRGKAPSPESCFKVSLLRNTQRRAHVSVSEEGAGRVVAAARAPSDESRTWRAGTCAHPCALRRARGAVAAAGGGRPLGLRRSGQVLLDRCLRAEDLLSATPSAPACLELICAHTAPRGMCQARV